MENKTRKGSWLGGNEAQLPGDEEEATLLSAGFASVLHSEGNRPEAKKDGTWCAKGTDIR